MTDLKPPSAWTHSFVQKLTEKFVRTCCTTPPDEKILYVADAIHRMFPVTFPEVSLPDCICGIPPFLEKVKTMSFRTCAKCVDKTDTDGELLLKILHIPGHTFSETAYPPPPLCRCATGTWIRNLPIKKVVPYLMTEEEEQTGGIKSYDAIAHEFPGISPHIVGDIFACIKCCTETPWNSTAYEINRRCFRTDHTECDHAILKNYKRHAYTCDNCIALLNTDFVQHDKIVLGEDCPKGLKAAAAFDGTADERTLIWFHGVTIAEHTKLKLLINVIKNECEGCGKLLTRFAEQPDVLSYAIPMLWEEKVKTSMCYHEQYNCAVKALEEGKCETCTEKLRNSFYAYNGLHHPQMLLQYTLKPREECFKEDHIKVTQKQPETTAEATPPCDEKKMMENAGAVHAKMKELAYTILPPAAFQKAKSPTERTRQENLIIDLCKTPYTIKWSREFFLLAIDGSTVFAITNQTRETYAISRSTYDSAKGVVCKPVIILSGIENCIRIVAAVPGKKFFYFLSATGDFYAVDMAQKRIVYHVQLVLSDIERYNLVNHTTYESNISMQVDSHECVVICNASTVVATYNPEFGINLPFNSAKGFFADKPCFVCTTEVKEVSELVSFAVHYVSKEPVVWKAGRMICTTNGEYELAPGSESSCIPMKFGDIPSQFNPTNCPLDEVIPFTKMFYFHSPNLGPYVALVCPWFVLLHKAIAGTFDPKELSANLLPPICIRNVSAMTFDAATETIYLATEIGELASVDVTTLTGECVLRGLYLYQANSNVMPGIFCIQSRFNRDLRSALSITDDRSHILVTLQSTNRPIAIPLPLPVIKRA